MSTLKVTNINAADGTSALSIADGTGKVSLAIDSDLALQGTGKVFAPNGIVFSSTELTGDDASTTTRTESSNLLDDYEEGDWALTVTGTATAGTANYLGNLAKYTKIGNLVYAKGYVDWNSGTGTGNLQISGLPFTSASDSSIYHNTGTVYAYSVAWTGAYLTHFVINGSTNIRFWGVANNSTATQVPYSVAGGLQFMCVYRTA